MAIPLKKGRCEVEGCSYFGPLIAKKCKDHYWEHRANVKNKGAQKPLKSPNKGGNEKEQDKELQIWFLQQIQQAPKCCEECGVSLRPVLSWNPKIAIAHILPKRKGKFPSVKTHPDNRMFYCWDCHTNFDNLGSEYAYKMQSLPLMRERYKKIEPFLTEKEITLVPNYLKDAHIL